MLIFLGGRPLQTCRRTPAQNFQEFAQMCIFEREIG